LEFARVEKYNANNKCQYKVWERYCVVLGGEGRGILILIHNMNMGKYKNSKNTSIRYNHIHVSFKDSKMLRVNV
jgi:hypothetical protein